MNGDKKKPQGEYPVGFAKAPQDSVFQDGHRYHRPYSKRPRGKKKARNTRELVADALREPILIRQGRKTRWVAKYEAIIRALLKKALAGDYRALRQLLKRAKRAGVFKAPPSPPHPSVVVLHQPHEARMAEIRRRNAKLDALGSDAGTWAYTEEELDKKLEKMRAKAEGG